MELKKAQLSLNAGQMQVVGPPVLVKSIELVQTKFRTDEAKKVEMIKALLKNWYVICSVTGEPISVADLKYWDVERKEVYKDAETALKRHEHLNKS